MNRKVVLSVAIGAAMLAGAAEKRNVLFIAIDDLRPQIKAYGYEEMHTPNLDRLAGMGMQFNNAHCQQAVCTPSRCSLLTGCRPDTTKVNYKDERTEFPMFEDPGGFYDQHPGLPQYFFRHGYYVREIGKVNHGQFKYTGRDSGRLSEPRFASQVYRYLDVNNPDTQWGTEAFLKDKMGKENWQYNKGKNKARLLPYERGPEDIPDEAYVDADVAREVIETLDRAKASGKPFFMAVGFQKPHLPFCAPKWAWDVYDRELGGPNIPLPEVAQLNENQADYLIANYAIAGHKGFPTKESVYRMSDADKRKLRHGYYACVTHVDRQVGKLIDWLEDNNCLENTVICVWGDHGWQLGDHGQWGKVTNFEWGTRVPLYMVVPGMKGAGQTTDALVELVDLYPTLLELCGLSGKLPKLPSGESWTSKDTTAKREESYLEGTSFAPLLDNPSKPWKKAAFSQFVRWIPSINREGEGFTVRTRDFRYTEWWSEKDRGVGAGELLFQELYDHRKDHKAYDPLEAVNQAGNEKYSKVVAEMENVLHTGWRNCTP